MSGLLTRKGYLTLIAARDECDRNLNQLSQFMNWNTCLVARQTISEILELDQKMELKDRNEKKGKNIKRRQGNRRRVVQNT